MKHMKLRLFIIAVACSMAAVISGCAKSGPPAPSATAVLLTSVDVAHQIDGAFAPDAIYAQVNSAWLKDFYPTFRAEIFRQGVVKWDDRFDCNHFAAYYVALAQTKFYLDAWRSGTPAQSLAIAQFWYVSPRGGHAIVVALTERGPVFIEPQTGEEVHLPPDQRAAALAVIF